MVQKKKGADDWRVSPRSRGFLPFKAKEGTPGQNWLVGLDLNQRTPKGRGLQPREFNRSPTYHNGTEGWVRTSATTVTRTRVTVPLRGRDGSPLDPLGMEAGTGFEPVTSSL
jgi:hypothetical protein